MWGEGTGATAGNASAVGNPVGDGLGQGGVFCVRCGQGGVVLVDRINWFVLVLIEGDAVVHAKLGGFLLRACCSCFLEGLASMPRICLSRRYVICVASMDSCWWRALRAVGICESLRERELR